ncbi:MAG: (d)CMP kinase [Cellulosilyticum sp.]|nr:(d)CMP kinase [Cellulosilyticum sp.]
MKTFSIAIDGPAGAGKSTIAKKLAHLLQCIYVDTGAMYRSVGYYCIRNGISLEDEEAVSKELPQMDIVLQHTSDGQRIVLNGEDVSQQIRNTEVAASASKVATYGAVRKSMVQRQQEMAKSTSIIMDGRDIGTVVLPFATLKIFLTASVEERAMRRLKEYEEKGMVCNLESLKEEISLRDKQDSEREISPLKQADDAIVLDTTHMEIDEIVAHIQMLLKERL